MRVLGRVERFGGRLQLQVRTVEAADADPAALAPAMRRDADELDGFLEFLAAEIAHAGARGGRERRSSATGRAGRDARCSRLRARTGTTGTRADCSSTPSAWRRSAERPPSCIRGFASRPAARRRACSTTSDAPRARPRPGVPADDGGRAPRSRPARGQAGGGARHGPRAELRAELLHAIAAHHDRNHARTAEAAVLYHANQLDAQAATRPVGDDSPDGLRPARPPGRGVAGAWATSSAACRRGVMHVVTVLVLSQAVGLAGVALWAIVAGGLPSDIVDLAPAVGAGAGRRGRAGCALPRHGDRRDGHRRTRSRRRARSSRLPSTRARGRHADGATVDRHSRRDRRDRVARPRARRRPVGRRHGRGGARARRRARIRPLRRRAGCGRGRERSLDDRRRAVDIDASGPRRRRRLSIPADAAQRRCVPAVAAVGALRHGANVLVAYATTRGLLASWPC